MYGYGNDQLYGQYPGNAAQSYQRQQMQPQPVNQWIFGKQIQSPNDIMPGDIPMNGTPCFFPMQDGSAIYMKAWSADGTIMTRRFLPEAPTPSEPTQMDRIELKLSQLFGILSPKEQADEQPS